MSELQQRSGFIRRVCEAAHILAVAVRTGMNFRGTIESDVRRERGRTLMTRVGGSGVGAENGQEAAKLRVIMQAWPTLLAPLKVGVVVGVLGDVSPADREW